MVVLNDGQKHLARRLAIKKVVPDIERKHGGHDVRTAYVMAAVLALQWGIALAVVPRVSTPVMLGIAWLIGACLHHMSFLGMHEAVHDLVFPQVWQNKLFSYICNSPLLVPVAEQFRLYHLEHHGQQGSIIDADEPTAWEKRTFLTSRLGRAFWLSTTFFWYLLRPVVNDPRPLPADAPKHFAVHAAILAGAGWYLRATYGEAALASNALRVAAYLLASSIMAMGLHVWVAHFVAEHKANSIPKSAVHGAGEHGAEGKAFSQEQLSAFAKLPDINTYSYYGWLNIFSFWVGYHVEHHDFPRVPGWKLPALHADLSAVYDHRPSTSSWARSIWDFIWLPYESPVITDKQGTVVYTEETTHTGKVPASYADKMEQAAAVPREEEDADAPAAAAAAAPAAAAAAAAEAKPATSVRGRKQEAEAEEPAAPVSGKRSSSKGKRQH